MKRFDLIEILDEVQMAKRNANGMAKLAMAMECMEKDDVWHTMSESAADNAWRIGVAEKKLKKLLEEG